MIWRPLIQATARSAPHVGNGRLCLPRQMGDDLAQLKIVIGRREDRMRIEHLYRYPVKGLTAEALEEVAVETGEMLPWDRAFALAQGDAPFDPTAPGWLQKTAFHVPDGQRPRRPAACQLRSDHRPLVHPRSGRRRDRRERAERAGARPHRRLPRRLPGAGGARDAAVPSRPRPRLQRRAGKAHQHHQPRQPRRPHAPRWRTAAQAAVPRQSLPLRRPGLERAGLGRAGAAGGRRAAARRQPHPALCRDRGEPGRPPSETPTRWRNCAPPSATPIWASMPR